MVPCHHNCYSKAHPRVCDCRCIGCARSAIGQGGCALSLRMIPLGSYYVWFPDDDPDSFYHKHNPDLLRQRMAASF